MDIILRLSAEGILQDREGNVFKVTEKVAEENTKQPPSVAGTGAWRASAVAVVAQCVVTASSTAGMLP